MNENVIKKQRILIDDREYDFLVTVGPIKEKFLRLEYDNIGEIILSNDIENGIPMCWPCHFKLQQSDPSMREEIMLKRGNEWYLSLMKRSGIKKSFKNIEYYNKTIKILEEKLNQ